MSQKTQKIEKTTDKPKKMSKKKKFMAIFFPIFGAAAIATGVTLGCVYGCHKENKPDDPVIPDWKDVFDDPGQEERHQKATELNKPSTFTFDLKEKVPEDEKIYGEGRVTKVSHEGVEAKIDNVVLNPETRKAVSFDAQITDIPDTSSNLLKASNEKITYSADFEVEVQCKKTVGDETVWTTTIEELTLEIEVEPQPPVPPAPEGDYLSIKTDKETTIKVEVKNYGSYLSTHHHPNLEYWNGSNWATCEFTFSGTRDEIFTIPTQEEDNFTVYFRGNNPDGFSSIDDIETWDDVTKTSFLCSDAQSDSEWEIGGSVMALVDNGDTSARSTIPTSSACFYGLFDFNNNITKVNDDFLPATTLQPNCYMNMFEGCNYLTNVPKLSAMSVPDGAYANMFLGCNSLVEEEVDLPATEIGEESYAYMFQQCGHLKTPATIHATTIGSDACTNMFESCSDLQIPDNYSLPATTLAYGCYWGMFSGCTSTTNTCVFNDEVTLAADCYHSMFCDCVALETIKPIIVNDEMIADVGSAFSQMFMIETQEQPDYGFYETSDDDAVIDLSDCADDLGFNFSDMFKGRKGGINTPETTKKYKFTNEAPTPPAPTGDYMSITTDKETTINVQFMNQGSYVSTEAPNLQYWDGSNWQTCTFTGDDDAKSFSISTQEQDGFTIYFRGDNSANGFTKMTDNENLSMTRFSGEEDDSEWIVGGSAMALVDNGTASANPVIPGESGCFASLFTDNQNIVTVNEDFLPAETLKPHCYREMFWGCTNLTNVPTLPAMSVPEDGYFNMFYNCGGLTNEEIVLPATSIGDEAYGFMFQYCEHLTTPATIYAETIGEESCYYMFDGCSDLMIPDNYILPATQLKTRCYSCMFSNCTSTTNTCVFNNQATLDEYCYEKMFENCPALETIKPIIVTGEMPATAEGAFKSMFAISSVPQPNYGLAVSDSNVVINLDECTSAATDAFKFMFDGRKGVTEPQIDYKYAFQDLSQI